MIKEQSFIKKDTSINWNKAKNFIPKENEVIVYTDLNKKKEILRKIKIMYRELYLDINFNKLEDKKRRKEI